MPDARTTSPTPSLARLGALLTVLLLAGSLALVAAPVADAATPFRDVPAGSYYADAVAWGQRAGITTGTSRSRFEPHRPVTRAELVTFLWRAKGEPRARSARVADVPAGTWYAKAVSWAVQEGVTTLVGGTRRFEPHRTASRAEAVTFLWRTMESPKARRTPFRDLVGVAWAIPAISWAHAKGVTTGVGGSLSFDPHRPVSRADALVFVWRAAGSPKPSSVQPSGLLRDLLKPIVPSAPKAPTTTTTTAPKPAPTTTTQPPKSTTTTTAPKPPATTTTTVAPKPAPTTTTTQPPKPPATEFVHPGVLLDRTQLDHVKAKLAQGAEPWTTALKELRSSGKSQKTDRRPISYRFSSLDYVPAPVAEVRAPSATNRAWLEANPQYGWTEQGVVEHLDDARAAYAHALLWSLTGDQRHADKAIEIMNAWSRTLHHIAFDQPRRPDTGVQLFNNGKEHAAWAGTLWARAGELVRHTGGGWASTDVARFEQMLREVYLPLTLEGWTRQANWLMAFSEATMSIGVFLDDREIFEAGVDQWRRWIRGTIYLPSDGPLPIPQDARQQNTASKLRNLWYNPTTFVSGHQQELCRDLSHMTLGLSATTNAAETARIQGVPLYEEERTRLITGFERSAQYANAYLDEVARRGGAAPPSTWSPAGWPCPNPLKTAGDGFTIGGWELAYQHFTVRSGIPMPQTQMMAERTRPSGVRLMNSWETITHVR